MRAFAAAAAICLGFVCAAARAESSGPTDVLDPLTFRLLNRQQQMRPASAKPSDGSPARRRAVPAPRAARHGDIAVVDTSDGVFQQEFPFDLNGLTAAFSPVDEAASGYTASVDSIAFHADLGEQVDLGDDDARLIPLDFDFPFFGRTYAEIWLNSDGNLTFGGPDTSISERDAARVLTGGPRICPLFADLDPSVPGGSVHAYGAADRLVVTWSSVPPYTPNGDGDPQTFQAALFAGGAIAFSYEQVTLTSAIVGLGAGDGGEAQAADFSDPTEEVFSSSVLEIFQDAVLDLGAVGQSFYRGFEDAYDFLVVFHDFDLGFETDAFAFYLPVRNSVLGIGLWPPPLESRNLVDIGDLLGSPRRLQGLMYMGLLDKYPDDPFARIDARFGLGLNTPLTILTHEAGHRFLARALFIDYDQGVFSTELLGRQLSHWSYFLNSEASLLEGNRIVDHGSGEFRFETVGTVEGFSSWDLYLMGLIPPQEVADTFFVRDPDIGDTLFSPEHEPLAGIFFNGERVDVSIEDIVDAHGRRIPNASIAQRNFRYAFLLVHPQERPPSAESLTKMERFRAAFDDFFDEMTGRRGNAETELRQELAFSFWPAAGLLQGGSMDIAVFRAAPSDEPVTVALESDTAAVLLPEQVEIAAGGDFARIPVEGVEGGIARIAGSAGLDFETARGAIRVHRSTASLAAARILPLEILFGDSRERLRTGEAGQPLPYAIYMQVLDENLLPTGSVEVRFEASADGRVSASSILSDSFGFVAVEWTLASAPGANQLTVSIPGSMRPEVVIDAVGSRSPLRQRNFRRQLFGR